MIIFAVTNVGFPLYKVASKQIQGSSVHQLSKDSSNIIKVIQQQYEVRMQIIVAFDMIIILEASEPK